MFRRVLILLGCFGVIACSARSFGAEVSGAEAEIRQASAKLVEAFNAGKGEDVAAMFLPDGEAVDEQGTIYRGRDEIRGLLKAYFEQYPGAKLECRVESVRILGPAAIEEGTRTLSVGEDGNKVRMRFIAVRVKTPEGWQLASYRDFEEPQRPKPRDFLAPLGWLVGEWIDEGTDAIVGINCRWSKAKNYLLIDYSAARPGKAALESCQRIGWDPASGKIRSWTFDSDGGFSEGSWTMVDGEWIVKSQAVLPDGTTGTATLTLAPADDSHFRIRSSDRIVGDQRQEDFDVVVARRPPAAAAAGGQ